MSLWLAVFTAAAFVAASAVIAGLARSPAIPARTTTPSSPMDHAEKILASRYARHEISADEYGRMLVVLRR